MDPVGVPALAGGCVRGESEGAGSWTGFSRRVRARPTEVGTPACAAPFPPFLAFVCRPPTTDRFRLTGLTGMPPIGYIVRQLIM